MSAPAQPITPDSVQAENLQEAYILWDRRRRYLERPAGTFDGTGRWFPSPEEHCACCNTIRSPSRHWPYSLMRHCRSVRHIANLYDVTVSDLRKEIRRRNPPIRKPVQEYYYKAVSILADGRYCSIYDGENTIYEIGVTLRQTAMPNHKGGYYVFPTQLDAEAFVNDDNALITPGSSYAILRCRCAGRKVSYGNGKLAFSEIAPVEVIGTIEFVDDDLDDQYEESYGEKEDYENDEWPESDYCDENDDQDSECETNYMFDDEG